MKMNDNGGASAALENESAKPVKKKITAVTIAKLGVFSALAYVLYWLKFPIAVLFPSFLEINLSDIPALLGGFAMGPVAGAVIVAVKCLLKLPFSSTACVGELGDFLIGLAFVLPSSLIYKYNRTKKGALIGMAVGSVSSVAMAVLSNWAILIPFYSKVFGSLSAIANFCSALYPDINEANFYSYYLPYAVVPFNLLRCIIACVLTFLLYKRVSGILNKF